MTAEQIADHLERQRAFSLRTFGPGTRTKGVIAHIQKEIAKIEADPTDKTEWADLLLLSLDGYQRSSPDYDIPLLAGFLLTAPGGIRSPGFLQDFRAEADGPFVILMVRLFSRPR